MLQVLSMKADEFAEYVRKRRIALGSLRDAEERGRGLITRSHISAIENLRTNAENISLGVLIGLGKAINESPVKLFMMATGLGDPEKTKVSEKIAMYVDDLDEPYQEDALALIRVLSDRHGKSKKTRGIVSEYFEDKGEERILEVPIVGKAIPISAREKKMKDKK